MLAIAALGLPLTAQAEQAEMKCVIYVGDDIDNLIAVGDFDLPASGKAVFHASDFVSFETDVQKDLELDIVVENQRIQLVTLFDKSTRAGARAQKLTADLLDISIVQEGRVHRTLSCWIFASQQAIDSQNWFD
jgi:hypothetical protein